MAPDTRTRIINRAKRRQRVEELSRDLGYGTPKAMLEDIYITHRQSIENVARMLGISHKSTRELLIDFGVPIRDLGARLHNQRVVITNELVEQITQHGVQAVAAIYLGVDSATLRYHLNKWLRAREVKETIRDANPAEKSATDAPVSKPEVPVIAVERNVEIPVKDPELYVRGQRITEADVERCLRGAGDTVLSDYRAGRLPKSEAYEMTRAWLKQAGEL